MRTIVEAVAVGWRESIDQEGLWKVTANFSEHFIIGGERDKKKEIRWLPCLGINEERVKDEK